MIFVQTYWQAHIVENDGFWYLDVCLSHSMRLPALPPVCTASVSTPIVSPILMHQNVVCSRRHVHAWMYVSAWVRWEEYNHAGKLGIYVCLLFVYCILALAVLGVSWLNAYIDLHVCIYAWLTCHRLDGSQNRSAVVKALYTGRVLGLLWPETSVLPHLCITIHTFAFVELRNDALQLNQCWSGGVYGLWSMAIVQPESHVFPKTLVYPQHSHAQIHMHKLKKRVIFLTSSNNSSCIALHACRRYVYVAKVPQVCCVSLASTSRHGIAQLMLSQKKKSKHSRYSEKLTCVSISFDTTSHITPGMHTLRIKSSTVWPWVCLLQGFVQVDFQTHAFALKTA